MQRAIVPYVKVPRNKEGLSWELNGGLGNQLFQTWAAHSINEELGLSERIRMHSSTYIREGNRRLVVTSLVKGIEIEEAGSAGLKDRVIDRAERLINRFGFGEYNAGWRMKNVTRLDETRIKLRGEEKSELESLRDWLESTGAHRLKYLSVSGYWQNAGLLLRHRKSFRERLRTDNGACSNGEYIVVHIRRGDYIKGSTAREYKVRGSAWTHLRASLDVMPLWTMKLPLIICSDDQEWAEKVAGGCIWEGRRVSVSRNDELKDWELMRNALILVGSNSTYSATAALLSRRFEDERYSAYLPGWYNCDTLTSEKGWICDGKIYDTL